MKKLNKLALKGFGLLLSSGVVGAFTQLPDANIFIKSAIGALSVVLLIEAGKVVLQMNKMVWEHRGRKTK